MYHHLGMLINLIVTQYFTNFHCVFYFIEDDHNIVSQNIPVAIINISNILKGSTAKNDRNLVDLNMYCQGFVIEAQRTNLVFSYIEQLLKGSNTIYRYNTRKYLLIVDNKESIDKILLSPHMNAVLDILFVSFSKSASEYIGYFDLNHHEEYNLWTTSFIAPNVYGKILLDQWFSKNQSFVHKKVLYSEKMPNQQGKALNISTYTLSPYSVIGTSFESSYGVDTKILQEYIRKYNFTPILIVDPDRNWGLPWDNQTALTGTVGQLVNGFANIAIGGLVYWPRLIFSVDTTNPYYACTIKCLVPLSGLPSGWILPFQPFNSTVWSVLFLTAVLVTVMHIALFAKNKSHFADMSAARSVKMVHKYVNCINHLKRKQNSLKNITFKVITVYMLQPITLVNCKMFSLLSFFSLCISIAYSSGLSSILTHPFRLPPVDKIEDIVNQDLKVGTTSIPGYVNTILYDERERYKKFVSNLFEANQTHLFNLMKHSENMALLIDRTLAGNIAITDYEDPHILSTFRIMKEDVLRMYIVGMVKRHSVLLPTFNEMAGRIFESGLAHIWDNEAIYLTSSQRIQKALQMSNNPRDVNVLKIIHVKGVFGIWFVGLLLSFLAFLGELYRNHRT